MDATPKQFRWQTTPAARAKRIEPEQWDGHKEELCEKYQKMTLDELIAYFKATYNFTPSRRQYIHKFEQWGFHKYSKTRATSSRMAPPVAPKPASLLLSPKMDVDTVRISGPLLSAAKRAAQTPSLRSLQSDLSRPQKPAKNPKLASWAASKTAYSGLGAFETGAFDPSAASVGWSAPVFHLLQRDRTPTGFADQGFGPPRDPTTTTGFVEEIDVDQTGNDRPVPGQPEKGYFEEYRHDRHVSRTPFHPYGDDQSMDTYHRTTEPFPPFEQDHEMMDLPFVDDPFLDPEYDSDYDPYSDDPDGLYNLPDEIATMSLFENESQVDHDNSEYPLGPPWQDPNKIQNNKIDYNRPIHEYKAEEIRNMKVAADYLFCLLFHEDAFPIYSIVKQWLQHNNRPAYAVNDAGIACARCPSSDKQDEIVRSFLVPKLEAANTNTCEADRFLSRMLMAEIYARTVNIEEAKRYTEDAMKLSMSMNILETLPEGSRTLDLLTYHNLTRCLRPNTTDEVATHVPEFQYSEDAAKRMDEYENTILTRVPGPFELQPSFFENSEETMQNLCLRSCLQWCSEQLKDTSKMPGIWKSMKRQHSSLRCAQCIALFTWLWHRWQVEKVPVRDPSEELWKRDTLRRMGISPTELLITVCWVINEASGVTVSGDVKHRISDLRKACTTVMDMPDRAIGMSFLECFACRNGLERPSSERVEFERVARDQARGLLQKALAILLPDNIIKKSQVSLQGALRGFGETMDYTPSLCSSGWIAFKNASEGVRAQALNAAAKQVAASEALADEIRFQWPNRSGSGNYFNMIAQLEPLFSMSSLDISDNSRASRASGIEMSSIKSGATARRRIPAQEDDDASSQRPLLASNE